ncbi:MAG: FecR domain-containing protein [Lachnospiraceae bacterium]|nr:FecR domain-containing protein [Lachnospiraceae bacterium]
MEEKKSRKKQIIIIAVIAAVVLAIAGFILMKVLGPKSYRVLKVYKVEGTSLIKHADGSEVTPYENMLLQSGDTIKLDEGTFIIKADEDKYIYLENGTEIILTAEGTSADSRTIVELKSGAVINRVDRHLSEGSVYEVNTPNATMSVRGTVVRVEFIVSANGLSYTVTQTFEGEVSTALVYPNGTIVNKGVNVSEGMGVLIYRDKGTTDYVTDPQPIDYGNLRLQTIDYLEMTIAEGKRKLSITQEKLAALKNRETYTVTFKNGNTVFATQTVKAGQKVKEPKLMPTASGKWNFDFDKTIITKDTEIKWEAGK